MRELDQMNQNLQLACQSTEVDEYLAAAKGYHSAQNLELTILERKHKFALAAGLIRLYKPKAALPLYLQVTSLIMLSDVCRSRWPGNTYSTFACLNGQCALVG
jgi:hypothetical protein